MIRSEHDNPSSSSPANDEFVFDESSGISKEDQKDILSQIEKVATESRIQVRPDVFQIKAIKRGVLFPIVINLSAALALAAGIVTLYLLFQRGEEQLLESARGITTAEGKLLEELKRESEEKLRKKNTEIADIQSRLTLLDRERQELQVNMEAKISSREAELRQTLEEELEAEKQKLREQGLSQEDIDAQLEDLESRKQAVFDRQLQAFREEAEAEREKAEGNLQALQEDFNRSLSEITAEREKILSDSLSREAALRAQMESKQEVLETEKTEAEAQLKQLEDQRQKEELVDTQLIGFYNTVKSNLESQEYNEALATLVSLRSYLDEDTVVELPGVQKRREVEFFVIDSLNSLIESEMKKEVVDTTSLIEAAGKITDIKDTVREADSFAALGQTDRAEELYREALSVIPEIKKSHEYFQPGETLPGDRDRLLSDYLLLAENAYAAKDYSATLDHFAKALEYLPQDPETIQSMMDKIRLSSIALENQRVASTESQSAAAPLREANALFQQARYPEALTGYVNVIAQYPRSNQVAEALRGIRQASQAAAAGASEEIRRLETALQQRTAEAQALSTALAEAEQQLEDLRAAGTGTGAVGESAPELAEAREALEQAKQSMTELEDANAILESQVADLNTRLSGLEGLEEELKKRVSQMEELESERFELARERDLLASKLEDAQTGDTSLPRDVEEIARLEQENTRLTDKVDSLLADRNTAISRLTVVNNEVIRLKAERDRISAEKEKLQNERDYFQADRDKLEAELQEATKPGQSSRRDKEEIDKLNAEIERLNQEIARLDEEKRQLEAQIESFRLDYTRYATQENFLKAQKGEVFGLLESKVHLNEFLASLDGIFPGLYDRIAAYDIAYEEAGRLTALDDITNILYDLSAMETAEEQRKYLSREKTRYADDSDMLNLLKEFEILVSR